MPYKSNSELPDGVKGALPDAAQSIFRRVFNDTEKRYPSYPDDRVFKIAWGAVKNAGYSKGKGDKWVKESFILEAICTSRSWTSCTGYYAAKVVDPNQELSSEVDAYETEAPFTLIGTYREGSSLQFVFLATDESMALSKAEYMPSSKIKLSLVSGPKEG